MLERSLVVLALCAPLAAQTSRNVTLLSATRPANETYSDVWGYVDRATGREYAILLGYFGVWILDATDPTRPVVRGYVPSSASRWAGSDWKAARTYGHWLYVVSEGGSGMMVIDLSDPDNPVLVRTHDRTRWGRTHTLSLDPSTGLCFACGTQSGMLVFDLAANPTDPPLVATYTQEYVHDMQFQDGWGFFAEIHRNQFRIVDMRRLPTMASTATRVVGACHNAWPTRDGKFCVTTSETTGPGLTVFDVRDRAVPQRIAQWTLGDIIHNAQVDDRLVHVSYYGHGYRLVDLSDPWSPVEIAYWKTGTDWGVYCFQPSGVAYAGDTQNGLEILRAKGPSADYGVATPGTGTPSLHTMGAAWLGNPSFAIDIERGGARRGAFLLLGTRRRDLDVLGLRVLVETASAPAIVLNGATDDSGLVRFGLPMPSDPALDGLVLHAQGLVVDPNGPLGLAATAGKTFDVFTR